MQEKQFVQQPGDNIWKISLALVCGGILAYGFFYSKNTASNLAFLIGYNLPAALIVWGLFYVAVTKKQGARISGFSFLAIFISMIASGLVGYSKQSHEAKKALSEIQNQFSEVIEQSTDSEGFPKLIDKPINTTIKASGEFGELERFMKEFISQIASQRNDYYLELEAIGWDSILDANRINNDKTFIESKYTIKKAKNIVKKYTQKTNNLLSITNENIRSLNISESSKRAMQTGFARGMEISKKNIDLLWALENEIISESENIINLLSTNKEGWVIEGEQILFYNDGDLDKFNTYIASIHNILKKQEEMQRQSIQRVNSNFDQLK